VEWDLQGLRQHWLCLSSARWERIKWYSVVWNVLNCIAWHGWYTQGFDVLWSSSGVVMLLIASWETKKRNKWVKDFPADGLLYYCDPAPSKWDEAALQLCAVFDPKAPVPQLLYCDDAWFVESTLNNNSWRVVP